MKMYIAITMGIKTIYKTSEQGVYLHSSIQTLADAFPWCENFKYMAHLHRLRCLHNILPRYAKEELLGGKVVSEGMIIGDSPHTFTLNARQLPFSKSDSMWKLPNSAEKAL